MPIEKPQERTLTVSELLESISPGLSSAELANTARTAESQDMVRFVFNPWFPIPNSALSGFGFGVRHYILKRMCLIPIKLWKVPVIMPRSGAFGIGAVTTAGAFPAGGVGSRVEQRLQYPRESIDNLINAYGAESANNVGMVELRSLAADKDHDKFESALLFRAVMETALEPGLLPGCKVILEDFPKFLRTEAPLLLRQAFDEGVDFEGQNRQLSNKTRKRGELLLPELDASVAAATRRALDEGTGILPKTKSDLIAAGKGMSEVKRMPDKLDEWLLREFPSYSLDTDVERATRANRSVTDAIRATGEENNLTMRELMEMNRQTLAQLAEQGRVNAQLAQQNAQLMAERKTA